MKTIIRSTPFKVVLFILCAFSVLTFVAAVGVATAGRISAGVNWIIHSVLRDRDAAYPVGGAALLVGILTFVTLMCVSGRRPHTDELCPGLLYRVPFDLMLAAAALLVCLIAGGVEALWSELGGGTLLQDILTGIGLAAMFSLLLGVSMSAAARLKGRTLVTNTLLYRLFCLIWRILRFAYGLLRKLGKAAVTVVREIPFFWKSVLVLLFLNALDLIAILVCWYETDNLLIFFLVERLLLTPVILFFCFGLSRLKRAGQELADGSLEGEVDTKYLLWDLKRHAENLNRLSEGMNRSIAARLKSERMKTELITNVSHDLKTPLTSIINYSELIAHEDPGSGKIPEYAEVLNRQSERLKHLIDDLTEASKAATGNLEVSLEPCDAAVFLSQTAGEYAQRMEEAGLTLVVRQPEEPVLVLADGRRMQRVFDNLMTNVLKYAQTGTRVYLTLEADPDAARITFRNISREPLDVSPDELLERFVRGDSSRNTSGSGLGLSIARSLMELQHGSLTLSLDGDLFKVTLTLPRA